MKIVKKTVALLAVSALLVGCTPSVTPEPNVNGPIPTVVPTTPTTPTVPNDPTQPSEGVVLTPLSAAWMQQIEEDWYTANGTDLGDWSSGESVADGIRYYGSYAGYDILFRPTGDDAITNLEVEDVTFTHNTTFDIYAYRDGSFTPLLELCQEGELTIAEVRTMSLLHLAFEGRLAKPNGPSINLDAMDAMKLAFLQEFAADTQYTTADLSVVYYGEYSGAHVGFINGIMVYTQALTNEVVGGVIFRYNTGQKLQVYFEGELMGLYEAHQRGILTVEDLVAIRNAHNPPHDNSVTK